MNLIAQRFQQSISRATASSQPVDLDAIRKTRKVLLAESDWTQLPDNGLSDAHRAEWAAYRQQLRDITDTVDLNNVVWPIAP